MVRSASESTLSGLFGRPVHVVSAVGEDGGHVPARPRSLEIISIILIFASAPTAVSPRWVVDLIFAHQAISGNPRAEFMIRFWWRLRGTSALRS